MPTRGLLVRCLTREQSISEEQVEADFAEWGPVSVIMHSEYVFYISFWQANFMDFPRSQRLIETMLRYAFTQQAISGYELVEEGVNGL